MEQLLQYDIELFLYLNNLGSATWDWFWLFMTNKYYQIPIYVVLLGLLLKSKHWKEVILVVLFIALLITITDQTATFFKRSSFSRLRPCLEPSVRDFARQILGRCIGNGYFSGHAANSMAAAVFLGLVLKISYRNVLSILLVWAILVGYSRIYVGVHYPLDVLTGFVFGASCAVLLHRMFEFTKRLLFN